MVYNININTPILILDRSNQSIGKGVFVYMYGYIYKTTNLINNKIYIGQHKSKQFEPDKYIGSGFLLNKAIKKYGINSFKCELIEWCKTLKELNNKEIYWINFYNSTNRSIGYNLRIGGSQGKHNIISKIKMSKSKKGKPGRKHTQEEIAKIVSKTTGSHRTEEQKKHISEAVKKQWREGKHNIYSIQWRAKYLPRRHINNGTIAKMVKIEDFENYIKNGWKPGRIWKRKQC